MELDKNKKERKGSGNKGKKKEIKEGRAKEKKGQQFRADAERAPPTFGDAVLQEVGPVAAVDPLVVGESGRAGEFLGLSVGALGVVGLAGAVGEDAEGVFADATGDGGH